VVVVGMIAEFNTFEFQVSVKPI